MFCKLQRGGEVKTEQSTNEAAGFTCFNRDGSFFLTYHSHYLNVYIIFFFLLSEGYNVSGI